MKTIYSIIILLMISSSVNSQDLHSLSHTPGDSTSFLWEDVKMFATGSLYSLDQPFDCSSGVTIDSLIIYNVDFVSARIELSLTRCAFVEGSAGSLFISIAFLDEDSNFVFGHSMISDFGFSLAGAKTDLQATKLILRGQDEHCYSLYGSDLLAIHQAFMYGPNKAITGDIKPIRYVSIKVTNLGAG